MSSEAGCFYCLQTFPPSAVEDWCDEGETAYCPRCGIDSVIGNVAVDVSPQLLSEMHSYWF